jgi:hypothetical protein
MTVTKMRIPGRPSLGLVHTPRGKRTLGDPASLPRHRDRSKALGLSSVRASSLGRNGGVVDLDEVMAVFRGMQPVASLPRLIEILQVRRLLALASGHQVAISAQVIVLVANEDLRIVLMAIHFGPVR